MSTKIVIEKSFREWTRLDLEDYIGLQYVEDLPVLTDWLTTEITITTQEKEALTKLGKKAKQLVDFWNETELRERFILKLTDLVDFDNEEQCISYFSERPLSFVLKQADFTVKLSGIVDWMVATGQRKPRSPFFFIHEYKAEDGQKRDGKGQLLAAMYTAQQLNLQPPKSTLFTKKTVSITKAMPIYGAYVVGKYWAFMALQGKQYSVSNPLISTVLDDLQAIFRILKAQKQIIYNLLRQETKSSFHFFKSPISSLLM